MKSIGRYMFWAGWNFSIGLVFIGEHKTIWSMTCGLILLGCAIILLFIAKLEGKEVS